MSVAIPSGRGPGGAELDVEGHAAAGREIVFRRKGVTGSSRTEGARPSTSAGELFISFQNEEEIGAALPQEAWLVLGAPREPLAADRRRALVKGRREIIHRAVSLKGPCQH
jgi:hypothetical protein